MMWGPYGWSGMGFWGGLGMLISSLVWLALVVAVVMAVVRWFQWRDADVRRERPLDILQRRYAAGEISREEYERMREELK